MNGRYDLVLVLVSIAVAVLASYSALSLAARVNRARGDARRAWLTWGAVVMGTGVWSMHFVGMLAFSLPVPIGYALGETLLSWVFAVAVSLLALHLACRPNIGWRPLLGGGLAMGAGICLMHYTGMAAMHMSVPPVYDIPLFLASVLVALAAATAALWIVSRLVDSRRYVALKRFGAAMVMGGAIVGMHYLGMAAVGFQADSYCLSASDLDPLMLGLVIAGLSAAMVIIALIVALVDARADSRMARMALKLQSANEELVRLALHDPLTQLPNRLLLQERMSIAFSLARREDRRIALLFVDLDGFKLINDTLGHELGDEVLREVANRLRDTVRETDLVARVGGDEFVLLLHGHEHRDSAAQVAERVIAEIERPLLLGGQDIALSASVGIAVFPEDGDEHRLLAAADLAMYEAKSAGRATWRCYSKEMERGAQDLITLQRELRRALDRGEFVLHYQPKVRASTGSIVGVEALIRWQDPERGLRMPGSFIPAAERFGLINAIADWVIDAACAQLAQWQARGIDLRIACNLSPQQFRQPGLSEKVMDAMRRHGVLPGRLELEITESTAMEQPEQAQLIMAQLVKQGVSLSIDDFGTGYSCLAYLRDLPVRELKIDRSFVAAMDGTPRAMAIVEAVVRLAQSLEMDVVAEGVETAQQAILLGEIGCDEQQGFLYARPLPVHELEVLLTDSALRHAA